MRSTIPSALILCLAMAVMTRAADLLRRGSGKPTALLATVLVNLSFVYEAQGKGAEMEKLRAEAVKIYSSLYGPNRLPPMIPAPLLPPPARDD